MNELVGLVNALVDDLGLKVKCVSFEDDTLSIWPVDEFENNESIEWNYYRQDRVLTRKAKDIIRIFHADDFHFKVFEDKKQVFFKVNSGNEQCRSYRFLNLDSNQSMSKG